MGAILKPNLATTQSSSLSGQCSFTSFTCYLHIANTYTYIHNPLTTTSTRLKVSQLNTPTEPQTPTHSPNKNPQESILNPSISKRRKRSIWKRFQGVLIDKDPIFDLENFNKDQIFDTKSDKKNQIFESKSDNMVVDGVCSLISDTSNENVVEFNFGGTRPDLSIEACNLKLKRFERENDSKTMDFFEWMRKNGKLKGNLNAYNLALRVVGRRENWDLAETMINEMESESGCEISYRIFNTLIYACSKKGYVAVGAKWFHMMLEKGVKPNEATFGMLMSLYQKAKNVKEAEFCFSQMRDFEICCQSAYSAMITIYTRMGMYNEAEKVITFLRNDGVVFNMENWLVLLNAYSQQGKMDKAEEVLIEMKKLGFPPNIIAYNILITGYGKVSKMADADRLFQSLIAIGLKPDEATYRSMIEGWGKANNYEEAQGYYGKLKRAGFEPNSTNLYMMINLQAQHGDENGVILTIKDMVKIGCHYPSVLSILLQAFERAEKVDKVPLVLKGDFYEHILSNQTSCSILAMAYVKHSLVDDTIRVLKDIKWQDRGFEDSLYHLLICSCKDLGHFENAVKIYIHMRKPVDKPNLHISCSMIDIYSAMNRFTEAEKVYLSLTKLGVTLDLIAYSVIVRMYIKAGKLANACVVLDTMEKQKNVIPDIYLIRDMLRVYQKCDKQEKLASLYYKLLKTEFVWDQEMYNCVINCCALALPVDELSRLFEEMLEHGFTPNTVTVNVILNIYGKSGLIKKAKKVFWIAKKRGLVDVISYNTMISGYGRYKYLRNMKSTVAAMQFHGFSVSLEAYNCMLDAYGKEREMEKFREVIQKMKETGCRSDNYTYNIIMNIYGENQWIEEVTVVLNELKEFGIGPDLCGYNTLIKAYGIAGMVEDAVTLVKEMRKNRIEPDKATYANLINALRKNDKFLEAVKWSLWMKQMGM